MLTDSQVRAAKQGIRARRLSDVAGLYLQIDPNGRRYWRYNYRFFGKQKTLALGIYPEVSIAKARERLKEAKAQLAEGLDPVAERQAAEITFETVARKWHARWASNRSKHYAEYVLKRLEEDVFPALGNKDPSAIPASAFRDVVRRIESRGALEIAKRVLQNCGQIMRFAVANDFATRNPVADIRPADVLMPRKKRHYPRVTARELPELLRAIDGYVGGGPTRLGLQLMALTFVRTSELIGARWSEFDLVGSRWDVPAERMKMKTPHIVPLSRQSKAILEALKVNSYGRDFILPSDIDANRPMSNNTLLFALYRLGYRGRMTGHGFRGVASTILHESGWPHEHIEIQLAHQERDSTSAAYNHALYLEPRTKMMQWWGDYIEQQAQPKSGGL
jgi:integrase